MSGDEFRWLISATSLFGVFLIAMCLVAAWGRTATPSPWRWLMVAFLILLGVLAASLVAAARDPYLTTPGIPLRLIMLEGALLGVDGCAVAVWVWTRKNLRSNR